MTVIASLRQFIFLLTLCLFTPSYAKVFDLVILGDSVSSGYGVNPKENWVELTTSQLGCKIKYLNLSTQGATSADGLTTLSDFYKTHQAKTLIIELGGNDALRGQSLTQLYKNLSTLLLTASDNKTKALLVGVDMPPNYGTFFRQRLKSTYEHAAASNSVSSIYLDFPNNPQLMQEDGIHPNALGHQKIAQILTPEISTLTCTLTP
jgi:acyl-CoA thioesterase-1